MHQQNRAGIYCVPSRTIFFMCFWLDFGWPGYRRVPPPTSTYLRVPAGDVTDSMGTIPTWACSRQRRLDLGILQHVTTG